MDDLGLPASPRKKPKLEELFSNAEMADTVTEAPAVPESPTNSLQSHSDTANDQLNNQTTIDSTQAPTSSAATPQTLAALRAAQISEPSITLPTSKVKDLHDHSEALGELLSKKNTNVSEAQSATTNTTDTPDDVHSKEAACGITEFVSPDLLGFSGTLKKRYALLIATLET